jgi:hypothetical protein
MSRVEVDRLFVTESFKKPPREESMQKGKVMV